MEMRSWKQSQLPQTRNREKNQRQRRLRTDYGQLFRNRIKEGLPTNRELSRPVMPSKESDGEIHIISTTRSKLVTISIPRKERASTPIGCGRSAGLRTKAESRSCIILDSFGIKNMVPSEILRNSPPAHRPDMIPLIECEFDCSSRWPISCASTWPKSADASLVASAIC